MKVLVTGGAGFIGSVFTRHLVEGGLATEVTVLDNLSFASNYSLIQDLVESGAVRFLRVDLRNQTALKENFGQPDYVINFAAETHVDRSIVDPLLFVESNVLGTANLLEESREKAVQKFVQISTDEVYGPKEAGLAKESDYLAPSSPYSASKAAADQLALAYFQTYKLPVVITRCSNNYGFGQHREKFIPTVLNSINDGESIPIYGDGSQVREWVSVTDHARGVWLACLHGHPGEIYNLGSEERYSNLDVIKIFESVYGESVVRKRFVEDRKGHDKRYALDSTKAQEVLGFKATEDLKSFVQETKKKGN